MKSLLKPLILFCIFNCMNSYANAQCTIVLHNPTKVKQKQKVEVWGFDDNIYVKLISSLGNHQSPPYIFTAVGQEKTISEIREYGVFSFNWRAKVGDKIELWEANSFLSDTRVLSYTFVAGNLNSAIKVAENTKYKITMSKGCL